MIIMAMGLKMFADIEDSLRQEGNLDFRRASIAFVGFKFINDLFFGSLGHFENITILNSPCQRTLSPYKF